MEQKELLLEYLQYRCSVYYSLKTIFVKEATMAQIRQLIRGCKSVSNVEQLVGAERAYVEYFLSIQDEQVKDLRQEMKPEYARLFLGPKKLIAPPYESVYRSTNHCLYGEATEAVKEFYRNAGMTMEEKSKLPEDFIGTELEFMYWMSYRMYQECANDEMELVQKMAIYQYEFLIQHMLEWIGEFAKDVSNGSTMFYFKVAADYLVEFLKDDAQFLAQWEA